jgi:hypothetical protein
MADSLNQKSIYVETDYDNIILIDPNKIVVDSKVRDRLVDHEDLVFYANLETRVIPRTKLAIGESFDSPVINSSIAALKGGADNTTINFLQPLKSNPTPSSKTKKFFDTSWTDQLTGSGSREGKGFNQTSESAQNRDGKTVYKRSVSNYEDTQTLGIKDINVEISGLGYATVKINLIDVQGRTLFEQGENSIYSVFFNLPYPLFYLTLKGYYGKAIRYALNLTKFNASFDQRTGNYDISLSFIGRTTGLLTDTLLTYAKTAPKMTPTTYQVQSTTSTQPGANTSNTQTVESSIGEQTLKEVYKIYKSKGLIEEDFPELTIDQFIQDTDNFVTSMQEQIEKGDFAVLSDVNKFREILSDVKDKVYNVTKNSFLDLNNYFFYKGEIYYNFKETVDYTKRDEIIKSIETEINEANKNLKQNKSFGDNASYVLGPNKIEESIVVNLKPNGITTKFPISNLSDEDFKKTLEKRLGRTATTDEVAKFKLLTLQNIALFSKKLDNAGNLVDDEPTFFKFGETEAGGTLFAGGFLFEIDNALKKLKIREEQIEKQFTEDLAKKITDKKGGLGFNPTIRNIFAILMAGVDTFYRLMDKTHTAAWNQRTNPKRLQSIIPADKNFGIDSKNVVNGKLTDVNIVYPWPTYFTKEKDPNDKSGREKYTLNYVGDPKYSNFTNAYDYTTWPEVAFLEDYINAQTKRSQTNKKIANQSNTNSAPFGSCNTLEFPFDSLPYQNISETNFFYEIFERLYVLTNYTNLFRGNFSSFQVDKFLSDLEAKNIITGTEDSLSLSEKLKISKFNLQKLKDYLKSISVGSYASVERDLYVTTEVNDLIKKDYGIYSIDTIAGGSISLDNTVPLIDNFDKYLKSSQNKETNFLDTWPCKEKLDATDKVMFFLDDKKTIARLNESPVQKNISLLIPSAKQQYDNKNLKILTRDNLTPIIDLNSLKSFYTADDKKYVVTEKKLEYLSTYSGNVSDKQSSSYLNTPYFVNALQVGVEKEKKGESNPYVALGYIFINSLPIGEMGDAKLFDFETGDELCNFHDTIRKYSAIHQIPYAYLLKLGSFWHRYKTYEEKNVDVVDEVFFDFVYDFHYDPTSMDLSKEYKVKNYDGNDTSFQAYTQDPTTNHEIYNYGFYPNLINDFHYYFAGEELFDDYSATTILKAFEKNGSRGILKMGTNTNANFDMALSGDSNNLSRKIKNSSYFQYLTFDKNPKIDKDNKVYMLIPSCGGIPINQANFECFSVDGKLKLEVKNNTAIYNGTVRSIWGAPQLGYFDYNAAATPDPQDEVISVTNSYSLYEIFSVFKKEMLDEFESLFLDFCNPNIVSTNTNLIQKETTIERVKNSKLKQLKYVLKDLFTIKESEVTLTGQQNNDTGILGQKQIYNLTQSIKEFLSYDLILKIGNSGEFERKLFGSFTNSPTLKPIDPIIPSGSGYSNGPRLPHAGSNYSVILSETQNSQAKEAWTALRVYVGNYFSYPNYYPELRYLEYTDSGSTITDFFVDLDIEFNVDNVKNFAKLIKIYATQKGKKLLAGQTYNKNTFISDLETFLLDRNKILDNSVVEVFSYLNSNLPTVVATNKNTKSTLDGNITKLSLYNTFQAFNDKWIAGSDLTTRTIFEDFLFHDTANHDIGDELQVDILKVKNILNNTDPATDILLVIGEILKAAGDLLFFSMPAYINFYGVNSPTKKPNPQNLDLPNSLFGTWTNVNYLDSRPKFICVYVGKEAERPDMKNNEFVLYADDSFDLRNPTTNPIRIETDKQNISLSNKVVAFNVDFGIRNQNMFTSINVSMNDKKPTNATFLVNDQLANGVNGDKIAQQTTSLYSLYKSMSYACTVESLGNVMIQPLMYFNLRHVPLFYGPYYIFKVKHVITDDKFTTTFDGSRMPKYALPQADSLATFIQANYLDNFKADILKKGSDSVVDQNAPTILDPENAAKQESNVLPSDQQCKLAVNAKYNTLPYVNILREEKTQTDIVSLINTNLPSNKTLKRFVFSLLITRDINLFNGEKFQILNNNPFGISATNEWPTNPSFKNLVCFDNGYNSTPLFSFDSIVESLNIIKNYYNPFIPMFNELNTLNRGITETELEAERKTIAQIIFTTWDTLLAFGPPPKTANEIIQITKTNLDQERFPIAAYDQYLLVAQGAQLLFP